MKLFEKASAKRSFGLGNKGNAMWVSIIIFYVFFIFLYMGAVYVVTGTPTTQGELGNVTQIGNITIQGAGYDPYACEGDFLTCGWDTIGKLLSYGFLSSDIFIYNLIIFYPITILFILAMAYYVRDLLKV